MIKKHLFFLFGKRNKYFKKKKINCIKYELRNFWIIGNDDSFINIV